MDIIIVTGLIVLFFVPPIMAAGVAGWYVWSAELTKLDRLVIGALVMIAVLNGANDMWFKVLKWAFEYFRVVLP